MLRATLFSAEDVRDIEPAAISDWVGKPDLVVWLDMVDPSDEELTLLSDEFDLHELALEDVRKHRQRPKLETYDTHTFIVGYAHGSDPEDLPEVDLFLGPGWLISVRERTARGDLFDVEPTRRRMVQLAEERVDVGFLLYLLFDDMIDGYFDVVEGAEDHLEVIEADLFDGDDGTDPSVSDRRIQRNLLELRRDLILLRRRVVPFRDVVLAVLRQEVPYCSERSLVYQQNVLDHLLRVIDQIDTQRELLGNVVDAHLALQANRMNQVMKKMTSWGAILIVATLIAGIYGMNFKHMPELGWRFGYPLAIGSMLFITGMLYLYFKRKDWL